MIPKFRAYNKVYGMRKVCGLTYTKRGIFASLENGIGNYIRLKRWKRHRLRLMI